MVISQNIYTQVKFIALLLLVGSLPFAIKFSNVLILLSVLISIVPLCSKSIKLSASSLAVLVVLFFFVEVISLMYTRSTNVKIGLSVLETHLPFLLVPFIFKDLEILAGRTKYLKLAFVCGCLIASIICLIANVQLSLIEGKIFHEYYFSYERISEPIGMQAVYFGLYMSLCVLIIIFHLIDSFTKNSFLRNSGLCILIIYFFLMIIASGARTIIVALMLITTLNVIIYSVSTRKFKYLLIASVVPIVFIFMILFNPVVKARFNDLRHGKTEGSNYDSYFARINIWKPGFDVLLENAWIGVGIGDQQEELNAGFMRNNYKTGVEFNFNMHNQYMQVMLSTGIVGLVIFLLILGLQFRMAIIHYDFLYLSFILLFSSACFTESMLNRNKGIIFFLIFSFIFFKSEPLN